MKIRNAIFLMIAIAALGSYLISTSAACNNKSGGKFVHQPTDTVRTLLVYFNGYTKRDEWGPCYRLTKDSLKFVEVDTVTQKKQWVRDRFYFVPVVDTLRDSAGLPKLDSATGRPITQTGYYPIPENWVFRDMNLNLDSLSAARRDTGALKPPK